MHLEKHLTPSVTQLINASLTSSELPTPLKLATLSPIFKNGDPSLATQYRPISPLPLVSKLLQKVVAHQLRSYLEEFSIIPKEQFAYDNITLLKTLLSMQSTTFSRPRTRGCTLA